MKCLKCLKSLNTSDNHYGMHKKCFTEWFKVDSASEFTNIARIADRSESGDYPTAYSSFFHGKFKKYSASLGNNSFILKMNEDELPELVQLEYLCNQIAELLKIPVAEYFIINFHNNLVFVTKNFIHHSYPMSLEHMYRFIKKNEEYSCEALISILKKETTLHSSYWVNVLIKTILFDSLIGNHDRHGRNLGLIIMSNNKSLAPIYDNISYLGLETGEMLRANFNPAGKIATSNTKNPSMKDYVLELNKLGYSSEVAQFHTLLSLRGMDKIEILVSNSFCSPLMKDALRKLITKRYQELTDALKT